MQVYLPDRLYAGVKEHSLPASEMLQTAVDRELRKIEARHNIDAYLADLEADIGPPGIAETAAAEAWAQEIAERLIHRADVSA